MQSRISKTANIASANNEVYLYLIFFEDSVFTVLRSSIFQSLFKQHFLFMIGSRWPYFQSGWVSRAVLIHRQGRHLPRAPDFQGPLNSFLCQKWYFKITLKGFKVKKFAIKVILDQKQFNSQGNKKAQEKIMQGCLIKLVFRGPSFRFCLVPPIHIRRLCGYELVHGQERGSLQFSYVPRTQPD